MGKRHRPEEIIGKLREAEIILAQGGTTGDACRRIAVTRLIGALLLEQNDEWAVQRARYMSLETIAPLTNNPIVSLPAVAA